MVPIDELQDERPRRTWIKRSAILTPAVAFIALISVGLFRSAPASLEAGEKAPAFGLPLLEGGGIMTDEQVRGRPVVINFWASWCIPCREEAPLLERTWRRYEEGVLFLGVNIKDAESDAKAFVEEFDITYPIVRDEAEVFAKKLGVLGIPETFFVDHEWSFVGSVSGATQSEEQGLVVQGPVSKAQLEAHIELLLARAASAD